MPITFGQTSAPSNITTYLDSVFETSLANYRKQLVDNIGAMNALLYEIINGDAYETADGGTYFDEPLMYGLAPSGWYDGYDTLSTATTDGITSAIYEWRQMATPISYNMKEVIQNAKKILDLVKSRITQAEMGIQEGWAQAFMWGNYPILGTAASLITPRQDPVTNALAVEPLPKLVSYQTTTLTVGNIAESTNTWWRCKSAASAATTYTTYLYELENMYNLCALGTGGPPNLILLDQVSYQLFIHAYFSVFKASPDALDQHYPFVGKKFLNAKIVMDDKVPDVFTGAAGTQSGGTVDPTTMTFGSAFFLNTKFFKIRYQQDRNFEMLKDENGKTFVKPINGDSRIGHVAWMGQCTVNNRRKQGVLGKIARTLTA